MKATLILMALLVAGVRADDLDTFIGGVYKQSGIYVNCGNGIATGASGSIIKCGDTYFTPHGVYVNTGGTYLGPKGSVDVKVGQDFVGTSGFAARAGDTYVGSFGASIDSGGTTFIQSVLK